MKLPDKKWYTITDLAKRWGCSVEDVQHLIETRELNAYTREEVRRVPDFNLIVGRKSCFQVTFSSWGITKFFNPELGGGFETDEDILIIIPQEVERFELAHGVSTRQGRKDSSAESESDLCERLKKEGLTDKEVARALKETFPDITNYRIGKLVKDIPDRHVSADAIRKRGKRLLE